MPEPPEPNIYQLKVVLLGISPIIWRRLLVKSDSTIADLHDTYKSHLDGPTIIFTTSLFMADNTALPISVGSIFVMTRGESNFPTSACASRKSSSTNTILTTSGGA